MLVSICWCGDLVGLKVAVVSEPVWLASLLALDATHEGVVAIGDEGCDDEIVYSEDSDKDTEYFRSTGGWFNWLICFWLVASGEENELVLRLKPNSISKFDAFVRVVLTDGSKNSDE